MFFNGRNKQLPFFSEYITDLIQRGKVDGARVGIAGGVFGALGGLTGAAVGMLAGSGVLQFSNPALVATILGIQGAAFLGVFGVWMRERKKAIGRMPHQELFKEVNPIASEMHGSLLRKKLHRDLTPTAAAILEEGARQWTRISRATGTAFWQDPHLADHWRTLRDQASSDVDRAMMELILLLQSCFKSNSGPQGWQGVVVDVVEQLGGTVNIERGEDLLPVTFDQAQELLEMMSKLADEVEHTSKDIISSGAEAGTDKLRSRLAISQTLQELKSVREAEDELRQNIGDR